MKTRNLAIGGAALLGAAAAAGIILMKTRRTIPCGVEAVSPFDAEKYLGTWYEIARMPLFWEDGLAEVTANYSLNGDGSIKVVNRGYDAKRQKWNESAGRAKFVGSPDVAMLKVSFFGPFWAGYNVAAIDDHYDYALVFGRNLDYMWLLSRTKEMPKKIENYYLDIAARAGYDLEKLVWTEHR